MRACPQILSCDEIEDTLNGIAAMLVGAPALGLQHFQAVCYVVSSASSKFGDDLPEPAVIARLQAYVSCRFSRVVPY